MLSCPELGFLLEEKTGSNLRAASTTFYYENNFKIFFKFFSIEGGIFKHL